MQKEFQKNLFNSFTGAIPQANFIESAPTENKGPESKTTETRPSPNDEIRAIQDQIYKMTNQVSEHLKNQNLRFEKLAQALHRLELSHSGMIHETSEKIANLNGKVSERKAVDYRIQELIDRQNTILQTYEVRLSQLQKVISEKEASILSLKAHLNDARVELSRLKR